MLQVPTTALPEDVKRAYRRLAREHHPDRGGDPGTFQHLHRAYERLAAEADGPPVPMMSRGTPSRPPVPFADEAQTADLSSVDWSVAIPAGEVRLDRDRLAGWLAAGGKGSVRPLVATSRSPGSRLNGVARLLAPEVTSRLRVAETADDRGVAVVAIEITAANRRARRALDSVSLDGSWSRTRRTSSTELRAILPPSTDRRATAVRTSDRLVTMLELLSWPLSSWTLTDAAP